MIKINRLEVIDHTADGGGRVFVRVGEPMKIEISLQDDYRTLKIFLSDLERKAD